MSDVVKIEDQAGVRLVILNRTEKKNALTQAMYAALIDAIEGTDSSDTLRVTVIAANGSVFTSGNDLADFASAGGDDGQTPVARFPVVLAKAKKPIIAAVNGLAVGVGVTMLAQCDLVYATEEAQFRTPFVDLALVPEGASSLLLPACVGRMLANELLLLGETWDAEDARQAGLLTRVLPADGFLEAVLEKASRLAAKPPGALRESKALMNDEVAIVDRIRLAGDKFAAQLSSPEFGEAIAAFMTRRPADFSKFV